MRLSDFTISQTADLKDCTPPKLPQDTSTDLAVRGYALDATSAFVDCRNKVRADTKLIDEHNKQVDQITHKHWWNF